MLQKDLPKIVIWGLVASFLVYVTGWFVNLADEESARYAAISMEIARSGEYFNNPTYIVAPRLLLWLSGLSMTVFGPNHIAYRLAGLLAEFIALYSVYRFSLLHYYSREVGLLAVLILATTKATFLLNNDVAAVNYEAAFFIFTIWQKGEYDRHKKLQNFVLCLSGGALYFLSKGTPENLVSRFAPFNLLIDLLWSFAPWTLFLFLGMWERLKSVLHFKSSGIRTEQISFYGFLIPFIILSLNPFQSTLDGFLVYPLGAVIAADYIIKSFYTSEIKSARSLYIIQITFSYLAMAALFCLVWFPFPEYNYYGLIHFMALLSMFTWLVFFSGIRNKLIIACTILAIGFNLVLNSYYYPDMSDYESGSRLGVLAKQDGVKEGRFFSYQAGKSGSLHFYSGVPVQQQDNFKNLVAMKNCWVYTRESFLDEFRALRPDLKIVGRSPDFKGNMANIKFLDPKTREGTITRMMLIRL